MNIFKELWVRGLRRARDEYEDTQNDIVCARPAYRWGLYGFAVYIACAIGIGIYWSVTPVALNVPSHIHRQLAALKISVPSPLPKGVATTSALIAVSETLLNKSGGFLANDFFPPGIWLDNMPNWELGVLLQVRDTTQSLRASLSQSNLNHDVDLDLQRADVRFNFSPHSWGFPASESQYRAGIEHLQAYNLRLLKVSNSNAQFNVDAQHLNDYLAGVEQRLKNLSQRLTASVGPSLNTDTAAMSVKQSEANKIVSALYTKTPWLQVDDIFYEARGSSWALIALLQGVEIDFSEVLASNNHVQASFDQIIRELEPTQQTVYSPMILNGEGFGLTANYSLTMASYLARAQAAVADCRRQLLVSTH
jgi:hypothetical protein